MAIHRLKDLAIRKAKPGKPGVSKLYPDGGNLYLRVTQSKRRPVNGAKPDVVKSWVFRYAIAGKERHMGLGSLDTIDVVEARARARQYRIMLLDGKDPIDERETEQVRQMAEATKNRNITFADAVDGYLAAHRGEWRSDRHARDWKVSVETYGYPILKNMAVRHIDEAIVLRVLRPHWREKHETMSRVRGRIEAVLDWAREYREPNAPNPASWDVIERKLENRRKAQKSGAAKVHHFAAIPYKQLPAFWEQLTSGDWTGTDAKALKFAILTWARTNEVRKAKWSEIDRDEKIWSIPPDRRKRMQQPKPHKVPLSDAAMAILDAQWAVRENEYCFPGDIMDQPINKGAMLKLLGTMNAAREKAGLPRWVDPDQGGKDITTHGFRSAARDWAGECTNFQSDVCEAALQHFQKNQTELSYQRGDLLNKRRDLMDAFALHLTEVAASNVTKAEFGRKANRGTWQ